jgi:VWFA-related protein
MRTGSGAAAVACVAVTMSAALLVASERSPRQIFRATTAGVSVDVTVRQGKTPVAGLKSEHFVLTDNGVRQSVDVVAVESVPVDLTLIIDASSSTVAAIDRFKANAEQIASMLRGEDRVRLVAISTEVTEVFSLRTAGERLPVARLSARGATSLHDALLLSIVRSSDATRRQLVVAFSDGWDTSSVTSGSTLATVAARSDCVLHLVLAGSTGTLPTTASSLRTAAESTGGALHLPGEFDDAVGAFRRVFEDFRRSYVLQYTLKGVEPSGWHDIVVQIQAPGSERYTVRAKRGYFGG